MIISKYNIYFFLISFFVNGEENSTAQEKVAELLSRKRRVAGGIEATEGQFPYIVSIRRRMLDSYVHICTGSIISEKAILTSAHCFFHSNGQVLDEDDYPFITVVTGSVLLSEGRFHPIEEIFIHHDYIFIGKTSHLITPVHDIAVVKLKWELSFSRTVNSIKLVDEFKVHHSAITVGWSQIHKSNLIEPISEKLRYLEDFEIISRKDCLEKLGKVVRNPYISSDTICVQQKSADTGMCDGDSGGPLVLDPFTDDKVLVGIASRSFNYNCLHALPEFYTHVGKRSNLDFIKNLL